MRKPKIKTTMNNSKSYLELEVIWKDDGMIELKITAANGRFLGTTEVYDTPDSLTDFAKSLTGFPADNNPLLHEAGQKNSYAFFSMYFYRIGNAGQVGVQIILEENVPPEYKPKGKDKITLEILVEPNAIDNFQKELFLLAKNHDGTAILYGHNN